MSPDCKEVLSPTVAGGIDNLLSSSKIIYVLYFNMLVVPMVTLEALNNFANESSGEANLLLRRSGDTDLEATVVLETSNIQPLPNPATGNQLIRAPQLFQHTILKYWEWGMGMGLSMQLYTQIFPLRC